MLYCGCVGGVGCVGVVVVNGFAVVVGCVVFGVGCGGVGSTGVVVVIIYVAVVAYCFVSGVCGVVACVTVYYSLCCDHCLAVVCVVGCVGECGVVNGTADVVVIGVV